MKKKLFAGLAISGIVFALKRICIAIVEWKTRKVARKYTFISNLADLLSEQIIIETKPGFSDTNTRGNIFITGRHEGGKYRVTVESFDPQIPVRAFAGSTITFLDLEGKVVGLRRDLEIQTDETLACQTKWDPRLTKMRLTRQLVDGINIAD